MSLKQKDLLLRLFLLDIAEEEFLKQIDDEAEEAKAAPKRARKYTEPAQCDRCAHTYRDKHEFQRHVQRAYHPEVKGMAISKLHAFGQHDVPAAPFFGGGNKIQAKQPFTVKTPDGKS